MKIATLADILPVTAAWGRHGLTVGGVDLADLAQEFGTPLYVYDDATLRDHARNLKAAFATLGARTSYASKACETLAVLRVFREEGLELDVLSLGEIEAALRAGFSPSRMHLHGNAKSDAELERAVQLGVHAVVIDNLEEIHRLDDFARRHSVPVRIMVRVRLALEAETHPHLQTSGEQAKFGISPKQLPELQHTIREHGLLTLIGIHAHLGSQIEDADIYRRAAQEMICLARSMRTDGFPAIEASIGGGWSVAYRPGDSILAPEEIADAITPLIREESWIRPAVEPGRALVARSAVALYRVANIKESTAGRLVAVDGGMGDNPRPALYGSRYHAMLIRHKFQEPIGTAQIVGRYCESGDILTRAVPLPLVTAGDLICMPVSGAYQLSMASTYNLVPAPAAVMVTAGDAQLITRRATIDDLLSRDLLP